MWCCPLHPAQAAPMGTEGSPRGQQHQTPRPQGQVGQTPRATLGPPCWRDGSAVLGKPTHQDLPECSKQALSTSRPLAEFLVGQHRAWPASLGVPSPALLAPPRNSEVTHVVVGGDGWPGPLGPAVPSSGQAWGRPCKTPCWRQVSLGSQVGPQGPSIPGCCTWDRSLPQDQAHSRAGAKEVWGVTDSRETQAGT